MDAQPIEQDALLRRAEVAAILCVGPKTVARWAKAGKLNSFRTPGGHRRYLKADVLALMTGVNHSGDAAHSVCRRRLGSIPAGHDGMIAMLAGTRPPPGLTPSPPLPWSRGLSSSPWKHRPMRRPRPPSRPPMR